MGSPLLLIGQKEAPLQTWGDGHCSWAVLWAGATDGTEIGNENSLSHSLQAYPWDLAYRSVLPLSLCWKARRRSVFCKAPRGKHRWRFCPRLWWWSSSTQPSQGCSRTVQHSVPYTTPSQAFAILCLAPKRAFPLYLKSQAAQMRAQSCREKCLASNSWQEQSSWAPKKQERWATREPPVLPLRDTAEGWTEAHGWCPKHCCKKIGVSPPGHASLGGFLKQGNLHMNCTMQLLQAAE